jgi:hypothetical protein
MGPVGPLDSKGGAAQECPPYWADVHGFTDCQKLRQHEIDAIGKQFHGAGNSFRWGDTNCAAIGNLLDEMINTEMYTVPASQAGDGNFHHPHYGIVLNRALFHFVGQEIDHYASQRFNVVTHELSHRLGLPDYAEGVVGPTADHAAAYCANEPGAPDPWDGAGTGGPWGGGDSPSPGGGCTTIYVDHYWYYPDTGHVQYRYTTTHTVCGPGWNME